MKFVGGVIFVAQIFNAFILNWIFWGENWLEVKSVEVGVVTGTVPPSSFESETTKVNVTLLWYEPSLWHCFDPNNHCDIIVSVTRTIIMTQLRPHLLAQLFFQASLSLSWVLNFVPFFGRDSPNSPSEGWLQLGANISELDIETYPTIYACVDNPKSETMKYMRKVFHMWRRKKSINVASLEELRSNDEIVDGNLCSENVFLVIVSYHSVFYLSFSFLSFFVSHLLPSQSSISMSSCWGLLRVTLFQ